MLSRTQVVNQALRLLAASPIADYDEDTESARQARDAYDQVVRAELESHAWRFAKAQAVLPETGVAPLFRYAHAYTLPSDCLRLIELEDQWVFSAPRCVDANPLPVYEVQGRQVLTDFGAPLHATYLRDLAADPTTWAASFSDVVAAALAGVLAMALTKSEGTVAQAERAHRKALQRAVKTNAIQSPPHLTLDGSWLTARIY